VHLRPSGGWRPPVLMTQAVTDQGIDAVVTAIGKHREWLKETHDDARLAERRKHEFVEVLAAELEERTVRAVAAGGASDVVNQVRAGSLNPYSAARRLIADRESLGDLLENGTGK